MIYIYAFKDDILHFLCYKFIYMKFPELFKIYGLVVTVWELRP